MRSDAVGCDWVEKPDTKVRTCEGAYALRVECLTCGATDVMIRTPGKEKQWPRCNAALLIGNFLPESVLTQAPPSV